VLSPDITNFGEMVERAATHAKADGFAKANDMIVIIAGVPFGKAGSTNNIRVLTV
jgi:pyruvate kinase